MLSYRFYARISTGEQDRNGKARLSITKENCVSIGCQPRRCLVLLLHLGQGRV